MRSKGRKYVGVCLAFLFILLNYCIFVQGKEDVEEMEYTISLNDKEFDGIYSGKTEDGSPEGKGTFSTDEDSEESFTVEGTFKSGDLDGKVEFTFSDGHKEIGKVEDNYYEGAFKIIETDGSYKKVNYNSGKGEGRVISYDASDDVAGVDWYYDGYLISDLIEEAEEYTAEEYYINPYMYVDLTVKVSGTVEDVVQTKDKCIIKLLDKDGALYLVTYPNGIYNKKLPTIVPAAKNGQKMSLYGIFKGITTDKISEDADYGYSFPEISAFYGEVQGSKADVFAGAEAPYEYEDICNNPYAYSELKIEVDGIVENVVVNYKDAYVTCKVITEEENIYFARLELENLKKNYFPVKGEKIKVKGTIQGNYRETTAENEVSLYPLILE